MKKKVINKILACLLAVGMVLSVAACGDTGDTNDTPNNPSNSQGGGGTGDSGNSSGGGEQDTTPEVTEPLIDESFTNITVKLPLTSSAIEEHHDGESEEYDRLVRELNEYTGMNITWDFLKESDYYGALEANIIAGNVGDVIVVGPTDSYFIRAAEEGLFWDLAPYLDEFDNLSYIPEAVRHNLSYNGKIYALPRARTLGRQGAGYRLDWLEALNMKEPETVEDWYQMLYAFTYNDPDGNGVKDTIGMCIENAGVYFENMEVWFGSPNKWGIDAAGNLVPKQLTEEWRTAVKEFRKWYEEGLIPSNFDEIAPGRYRQHISGGSDEGFFYGAGTDVLDNLRKIEKDFEGEDYVVGSGFTFKLVGGMKNTDGQLHVMPTDGFSGGIAISTTNVKTEAQLRRVLQFLNDYMDSEPRMLVNYGFQNQIWYLGDDGYIHNYTDEEHEELGISSATSYRDAFNQIQVGYYAPENEFPFDYPPNEEGSVEALENALYQSNLNYVVINYGAGYVSETENSIGAELNSQIDAAKYAYIKGEIDDVGLDAQIQAWLDAGMQKIIEEKNASYHAAGN